MPLRDASLSQILGAMGAGDWAQAEAACHAVLDRQPDLPEARRIRSALELIRQGLQQLDHGDAAAAAVQFRRVIAVMPEFHRAHNLLGNALLESGDYVAAEAAYRESVRLRPDYAAGQRNLGAALLAQGKAAAAIAALESALMISPGFAPALDTLADALIMLDRREEGVAALETLLAADPENMHAAVRLGDLRARAGRFMEAAEAYQRVLSVFPHDADILEKLAHARLQLKQFPLSLRAVDEALALQPDRASLHANRGCVLERLNRHEEALTEYERAIRLQPDDVNILNNLTGCLIQLQRFEEALPVCRKAQALTPESLPVLSNMARLQQETGNPEAAIAAFRHAVSLYPDEADLRNSLGVALDAAGLLDEAVSEYRAAHALRPDDFPLWSNVLFAESMRLANVPERYLAEARTFGRRLCESVPPPYADWPCQHAKAPDRLRIGLVSGDFKQHPVGYFLESTIGALSGGALDLIAFNTEPRALDALGSRLRPKMRGWHDISRLSHPDAAALIRDAGIHILLDLSGHTAHNALQIFAMKPAPVQASWLGYWASTGIPGIDYFITDPISTPPGDETQFSETLWRLPHTRFCFSPPMDEARMPVGAPPWRENGHLTFGCFQRLNKLNDDTLAAWAGILNAVPDSRLLLKSGGLSKASIAARLTKRLADFGVAPHRLSFEDSAPREDYLRSYHRVDVMLDTYPFPGGTTTCEALWMGVPTLTLTGQSLITRQGASLLNAAGLRDWIAHSPEELLSMAQALPGRTEELTRLRLRLRQQLQATPLMNASLFARDFEEAMWGMWRAFTDSTMSRPQPCPENTQR